ncbi:MAG TPA: PAS domain-containing protein [Rhizomicrobium sp.]|jgi:hypothetical protein|nr:PAS domain-containing protein [Rhizomicrobium sp.]
MTEADVEYDPDVEEPQLLVFVRSYWQTQRGAAEMPRRQDIAPSAMKTRLAHILLADVVNAGGDFRYRLVGSELQRYFKGNPTGRLMSEALAPFGPQTVLRTIHTYATAVARRAPLRIRGTGALYAQSAKQFDALLAPLSDDKGAVNMVLGTFLFEWDFRAASPLPGMIEPDEAAFGRALHAGK